MRGAGLEAWSDFFVATAGAAAALAGLVIVAISVNVERILAYRQLPSRAIATIATLVLVLVVSVAGLAEQAPLAYGLETLAFGITAWLTQVTATRRALEGDREGRRPLRESVIDVVTGQLQTLPFLAAGVLLLLGSPAAVYLIFSGALAVFVLSMANAWVLLVEILR